MQSPLDRDRALELLHQKIESPSLRKHSYATEAIMRHLARHFGEPEDFFGIVGLLHDLDLEAIDNDMTRHGLITAEWLEALGFPESALQAIRAHNGDILGITPKTRLDFALTAAESLTGLISATALIYPSRKVKDVKLKSLRKRMREPRFAANVSRELIGRHEQLGLDFDTFASIGLAAMSEIADDLGL